MCDGGIYEYATYRERDITSNKVCGLENNLTLETWHEVFFFKVRLVIWYKSGVRTLVAVYYRSHRNMGGVIVYTCTVTSRDVFIPLGNIYNLTHTHTHTHTHAYIHTLTTETYHLTNRVQISHEERN